MPELAEKYALGETSIMNKIVVCHFYFAGRQITHCIACSIFFLKSGHLIPSGMYSEWEPVFSSQINLERISSCRSSYNKAHGNGV